MFSKKTKLKLTDFERNLLINGMNEFRNMLATHYHDLQPALSICNLPQFCIIGGVVRHHISTMVSFQNHRAFSIFQRL